MRQIVVYSCLGADTGPSAQVVAYSRCRQKLPLLGDIGFNCFVMHFPLYVPRLLL